MLRIRGVNKDEATEEVRKIFEDQEKQYGSVLNTAHGLWPQTVDSTRCSGAASGNSGIGFDS